MIHNHKGAKIIGIANFYNDFLIPNSGYYVNCYTFLEEPEKDWAKMVQVIREGLTFYKTSPESHFRTSGGEFVLFRVLADSNEMEKAACFGWLRFTEVA